MSYGREKFLVAVDALVGRSSQAERLFGALVSSLIHLQPRDLPEEIREDFAEFMKQMTSVEAKGGEGNVQATINTLTADEIDTAVNKILEFHYYFFD